VVFQKLDAILKSKEEFKLREVPEELDKSQMKELCKPDGILKVSLIRAIITNVVI